MKTKIIYVALIAVLGVTAVSCQKEPNVGPQINVTESAAKYTITYSVNGVVHTALLQSEEELNALLRQLVAYSRQGYQVVVSDNELSSSVVPSKETVTYTTRVESDAISWAEEKVKEGYVVTISFDETTGVYTCVATRKP